MNNLISELVVALLDVFFRNPKCAGSLCFRGSVSLSVAALRLVFSAHFVPSKYTFKTQIRGPPSQRMQRQRTHAVTKGKRVQARERETVGHQSKAR